LTWTTVIGECGERNIDCIHSRRYVDLESRVGLKIVGVLSKLIFYKEINK